MIRHNLLHALLYLCFEAPITTKIVSPTCMAIIQKQYLKLQKGPFTPVFKTKVVLLKLYFSLFEANLLYND